jgi:RHH-type proline utilization regulon transcriptional repressor/proline dehydrogenase/delta 1-pyrroline-5-carboxylate dehydrogenase
MTSVLEDRVRAFGREIFARLDRGGPMPFTQAWLNDQLMAVSMGNEALKVQLFRFVDTLPYLHDPRELSKHLREYLSEAKADLPWWVRHGIRFIPRRGPLARLLAATARANSHAMAKKFIAGSNVPEAIEAVRRLRAEGQTFTVDLLGEATVTEPEADHVQKQYLDLIAGLTHAVNAWPEVPEIDRDDRGPIPRVNVSVKLSALFSQFDPIDPEGTKRAVLNRLRPILFAAKRTGAFVNFDMEQYSFKDVTLKIFRDVLTEPEFRDWPHVGIAMQAYLTDTENDLHQLLDWVKADRRTPIWIRLVKGAYWDYETVIAAQQDWPVPVFTQKWQSDASFERCSRLLLANADWMTPAFASHNVRSMAHAMAVAEELQVPPRRYEFQMLYGMADPLKASVTSLGHRVRIYTPYGELLPGMAYLVRRLLENTSNDSFLRASFADGVPEEVLLMNPEVRGQKSEVRSQQSEVWEESEGAKAHGRTSVGSFRNEPLADFAKEENRAAMRKALAAVRAQFGREYPVVIDNVPVPTTLAITSVNPSHATEIVGRCGAATPDLAKKAVASSLKAFDSWRDRPTAERAAFLRKIAAGFRRRRFELAAWIVLEVGKPWREADADVAEAIDFCEYYALEGERLQGHDVNLPGEENAYFYEPRGVAVVIAPWNFPLAILCGMATAALVTGNTVILKPAEQSSVVGAKLMEVILEAGLPPGVVNFLPGVGEEIGPVLVEHPDVALIAFTGSLKVALAINEAASKTPGGQTHVKKVIAEMGGKNAIIVDSDADLDEAVRGVVDAAFGYAGQKCSAGSRAIVLAGIYDQFLTRLVEATKSLTVSPAELPGCSVGPVIDRESQERLRKAVEAGKKDAKLLHQTDLGDLSSRGFFVGPTVFADVPETSPLAQDEFFGPVLSVMKAKDLDDAIRLANGVKYALTGAVFSRSPENIAAVKRRFRVGNLYVNRKCTGALVNRQPFGGFKLSGIGSKAGGPDYLLQFVLPRTVTENTMRRGFAPDAPGE